MRIVMGINVDKSNWMGFALCVWAGSIMLVQQASAFTCETEDSSSSFLEICTGEIGIVDFSDNVSSGEEEKTWRMDLVGPFTESSEQILSATFAIASPNASGTSNKDARDVNSTQLSIDGEGSSLTLDNDSSGTNLNIASVSVMTGHGHSGQTNDFGSEGKRGGNGGSIIGDFGLDVQDLAFTANNVETAFYAAAIANYGNTGGDADDTLGVNHATGGTGGQGGSITGNVILSLDNTQITESTMNELIVVDVEAGAGGNGGKATADGGGGDSGDGGDGGSIDGDVTVSIKDSNIDASVSDLGVSVNVASGAGGNGGKMSSAITGHTIEGGAGGNGGDISSSVSLSLDASTINLTNGGFDLVVAAGTGGDGGKVESGGDGELDPSGGGDGGSIEASPVLFLVSSSTVNLTNDGFSIRAEAGTGGQGGDGDNTLNAVVTGGKGGVGGSINFDSNTSLLIQSSSIGITLADGNTEPGISVVSQAGTGGRGGDGESSNGITLDGGDGAVGGSLSNQTLLQIESSSIEINISDATDASAIYVASQGGTGGKGGHVVNDDLATTTSRGGDGGLGGDASTAELVLGGSGDDTAALSIESGATDHAAIHVLSQGGAGGAGNFTNTFGSHKAGNGGDGRTAGIAALILNEGSDLNIVTTGDNAEAILIESIGGTGGQGGWAFQDGAGDAGDGGFAALPEVGLIGGEIRTEGEGSHGIRVYSAAGAGGMGAEYPDDRPYGGDSGNGGNGGNGWILVGYLESTTVETLGNNAVAVYIKSEGGAGGAGGSAHTQDYKGGNGGDGGDAGLIAVEFNSLDLNTAGESSVALYIASTGGAAGSAGQGHGLGRDGSTGLSGSASTVVGELYDSTISTTGKGAHGVVIQSTSNSGRHGGGGDRVEFYGSGEIEVLGDQAHGVVAQSMANVASFSDYVAIASSSGNTDYNSENVVVVLETDITTYGESSFGILAESISANSGTVFIDTSGDITLSGNNSTAIRASSQGNNSSGPVQIYVNGAISASGDNSSGIYANSTSSITSSILLVIEDGGSVLVGENGNHAIEFSGGDDNNIINAGTISKPDSDSSTGYAIYTSGGGMNFSNSGTFIGSVFMDSEDEIHDNFIKNEDSGIFMSGAEVSLANLGEDFGFFENFGTFSPGGPGVLQTTTYIGGAFWQYSTGILEIDLNVTSGEVDVFQTAQSDINLLGTVSVSLLESTSIQDGATGVVEFIKAAQGNVDSSMLEVESGAVIDYSLSQEDIGSEITIDGVTFNSYTAVELGYTVDFTGGLDEIGHTNGVGFGNYWADIIDSVNQDSVEEGEAETAFAPLSLSSTDSVSSLNTTSSAVLTDVQSLILSVSTQEALQSLYDGYVVDEAAVPVLSGIQSMLDLMDTMHSRPQLSMDPDHFLRLRERTTLQAIGGYTDRDNTANNGGYNQNNYGVTGSIQQEIGNGLFYEFGGIFESVQISGNNYSQDGERYQLALALKYEDGPLTVSGTVGGGYYDLDYDRNYFSVSGNQSASADITGGYIAAEARVSYLIQQNGYYLRPIGALTVTHNMQDGFSETGSGPINWNVDSIAETDAFARFMLELGGSFEISGLPTLAFVRPGLTTYLTNRDVGVDATLSGLSTNSLSSNFKDDQLFGELTLGIETDINSSLSVALEADGAVSANVNAIGGTFRVSYGF
ncbi:autotransporter outer membrane beta-barrel domain-containing protein [Rubellicoccus peritrichatus]|uniref:Autotransporter outer membrane beta-barrel domain-containing protein n=1 Tax=Rubellicoccus peritrichatus TaxID=3080537 RepID=A0AAQ3L9W1_9BACT|nr:autotransporter outer membrane beta-barrel domain-containing protein [Puniceicoccus sp. CR14]WOO39553.1 autotransporter outer membrane beta-barrel domain-containing protein [Puniceicoccus sp. CR14]